MREDNSSKVIGMATAAGSTTIIDGTAIGGTATSGMIEIATAVNHPQMTETIFGVMILPTRRQQCVSL